MGGRSGQGLIGGGGVTETEYNSSQTGDGDIYYASSFNGDFNSKTINAYTDTGYIVNSGLTGKTKMMPEDLQYVKNLDKSLKRLPNYKGIVYRVVKDSDNKIYENMKNSIGKVVKWKGYVSSSKDKDYQLLKTKQVGFVIRSKRGKSIEHLSAYAKEKEVLFGRDTNFKIVAFRNGKFYLKEL